MRERRISAVGMWIYAWCLIGLCINPVSGISQESGPKETPHIECVSNVLHERMLDEDQSYRERHEEMERSMATFRSTSSENRMTVHTIPVVVHILHNGEAVGVGSNISDEQIQSAIIGLNEDYRRMAGTNGFGAGVDVEMQFCLASRDPQGDPTNGIMRVDASGVTNYSTEGMSAGQGSGASETALKALSKWDRDDYYNIWIVNEIGDNDGGSGIQGFAYFPSSSASRDGAVILYNAFGTVGNLKGYTSLNRTVTHEVGHAFSLYHTFQGNTCSETDCSSQGDRVCDTPATTTNTNCNTPACSGTQQVENYMDYTSEGCMDMFTQGQKTRMRDALMSQRSSLLQSLGCTPPNSWDTGITSILSPSNYSCNSNITPRVVLKNFGANTVTSVNINYRVDNGPLTTYSWSGSLPSTEAVEVSLPGISASAGAHSLEVFTESPNGNSDGFQSNDTRTSAFTIVEGSIVTVSIEADNYGNETTWAVRNSANEVVAVGGPYPTDMYGTTFEQEFCLPAGCFEFTIYDSYGDGMCCGGGFGGYSVTDDQNNTLAESGADFTTSESTDFCIETSADSAPNANFSASSTQICAGGSVQFSDQSTGNPSSRTWTFQGGTPATSTAANPTVTFNSPGPHDVTLTVSNSNGSDTESKNDHIAVGTAPNLTASVINTSCWNSSDGIVNLSISGGTTPFDYSWSTGSSGQDISGLTSGTYTVNVTDGSSCTSSASYTVESPINMNLSNTSANPAGCASDGSASVQPTGGTPGYSYLWNDPSSQTTATAVNLSGGSYTVVVTDANGCQKTKAVTVESSGGVITSEGNVTHVSCNGLADGSATVNVSGGVSPYSYSWSPGVNQNSATASGLPAGNVSVLVTDNDGCSSTRSFTIAQPAEVQASLSSSSTLCFGSADGALNGTMSGGVPPYTYHWAGAGFGQTLTPENVTPGTYTFVAIDANGCQNATTAVVAEPQEIQATLVSMIPDSCQLDVGSSEIEVTGGVGMYNVTWDDPLAQEGFILQNVRHGLYVASIRDQNECLKTKSVVVEEADCAGVTTVNEIEAQWAVKLFPNPLHGQVLNIDLGAFHRNDIEVELVDITGKSVQQEVLLAEKQQHQIIVGQDVAEGIYLLQLNDGRSIHTQRVMVIR